MSNSKIKQILDFLTTEESCHDYFKTGCSNCILKDQCRDVCRDDIFLSATSHKTKEEIVRLFIKDRILINDKIRI
jgi:hypothetical protein